MGQTSTPTFRVEAKQSVNCRPSGFTAAWNTKLYGRPTKANLEKWRRRLNLSYLSGGVNHHISETLNRVPHVYEAQIIRQATGDAVVKVFAPMFEVIGA